jgi:hypothetical protein
MKRHTKKRVGASEMNTLLLVAGGAALLLIVMNANKPAAPVVIRTQTTPTSSGSGTALAEIAAGSAVATGLLDYLSSDQSS